MNPSIVSHLYSLCFFLSFVFYRTVYDLKISRIPGMTLSRVHTPCLLSKQKNDTVESLTVDKMEKGDRKGETVQSSP